MKKVSTSNTPNITVNEEADTVANLGESFEKILTQMEQAAESADPVSGTPNRH